MKSFNAKNISIFILILLSAATYSPLLNNQISAGDTLLLLYSAQIESFTDFYTILSSSLMQEYGFDAIFYRPISILSYSADIYFWGNNYSGYYFTNILFHSLNAILVFLICYRFTKRHTYSLLSAALFLLHPTCMEVLPSIARRQDILSFFFSSLSIYALSLSLHKNNNKTLIVISLTAFFLAIASKEVSLYVPVVAFALITIHRKERYNDNISLIYSSIKTAALYAIPLLIYLALRINAVESLTGTGYRGSFELWRAKWTIASYLPNLLYPQNYLSIPGFQNNDIVKLIVSFILLIILCLTGYQLTKTNIRLATLLITWLLGPLLILIISSTSAIRSHYSAIPPAMMLLLGPIAVLNYACLSQMQLREKAYSIGATLLVILTATPILVLSPTFHSYAHWDHVNNSINTSLEMVRTALETKSLESIESIERIEIRNIPSYKEHFKNVLPSPQTPSYVGPSVFSAYLIRHGINAKVDSVEFEEVPISSHPLGATLLLEKNKAIITIFH